MVCVTNIDDWKTLVKYRNLNTPKKYLIKKCFSVVSAEHGTRRLGRREEDRDGVGQEEDDLRHRLR